MINITHIFAIPTLIHWRAEVLRNVFHIEPQARLLVADRRYYRSHIGDGSHLACVADVDGVECGCGAACFYDELPSPENSTGRCAYLMNIYVREPFRCQGVAHAIVKHLIAEAKARECRKIYLETTALSESVYKSLGFMPMDGMMKLT